MALKPVEGEETFFGGEGGEGDMIDDFLGSTYCTYIYTVYNMIIYI